MCRLAGTAVGAYRVFNTNLLHTVVTCYCCDMFRPQFEAIIRERSWLCSMCAACVLPHLVEVLQI